MKMDPNEMTPDYVSLEEANKEIRRLAFFLKCRLLFYIHLWQGFSFCQDKETTGRNLKLP